MNLPMIHWLSDRRESGQRVQKQTQTGWQRKYLCISNALDQTSPYRNHATRHLNICNDDANNRNQLIFNGIGPIRCIEHCPIVNLFDNKADETAVSGPSPESLLFSLFSRVPVRFLPDWSCGPESKFFTHGSRRVRKSCRIDRNFYSFSAGREFVGIEV